MKRPRSGDPLGLLQADLVAERFEALDETTLESVLVAAVEVVAAEVMEVGAILEEVVADDEDRVGDGDGRLLLTTAGGQTVVLRAEVGVAGATGRLGRFDEGGAQVTVPLRVLPLCRFPALS